MIQPRRREVTPSPRVRASQGAVRSTLHRPDGPSTGQVVVRSCYSLPLVVENQNRGGVRCQMHRRVGSPRYLLGVPTLADRTGRLFQRPSEIEGLCFPFLCRSSSDPTGSPRCTRNSKVRRLIGAALDRFVHVRLRTVKGWTGYVEEGAGSQRSRC
jgi:hypothetical protein